MLAVCSPCARRVLAVCSPCARRVLAVCSLCARGVLSVCSACAQRVLSVYSRLCIYSAAWNIKKSKSTIEPRKANPAKYANEQPELDSISQLLLERILHFLTHAFGLRIQTVIITFNLEHYTENPWLCMPEHLRCICKS